MGDGLKLQIWLQNIAENAFERLRCWFVGYPDRPQDHPLSRSSPLTGSGGRRNFCHCRWPVFLFAVAHWRQKSGNICLSNLDGYPECSRFKVEAKFSDRSDDIDYDGTHP